MTIRLILIRHTKSDWGGLDLKDHDRPLSPRGENNAPRIGSWLAAAGFVPNDAAVSTAKRTRQTWAGIRQMIPGTVTEHVVSRLYEASAETIFEVAASAHLPCRAIVGHNPGIGDFMHRILRRPVLHPRFQDVPTGSVLVASFPIDEWHLLRWGSGTAEAFVTPHDL